MASSSCSRRTGMPVVFTTDRPGSPAVAAAIEAGLVVGRDIESAARALRVICDAARAPDRVARRAGRRTAGRDGRLLGVAPGGRSAGHPHARCRAGADGRGGPRRGGAARLSGRAQGAGGRAQVGRAAAWWSASPARAELRAALNSTAERLAPEAWSVERMLDGAGSSSCWRAAAATPRSARVVVAGAGGTLTELAADTAVALGPIGEDARPRAARPAALRRPAGRLPRRPAAGR